MDAYNYCKTRAEPLYELSVYYREKENWTRAYYYAQKSSEIPIGNQSFFVSNDIYEWKAVHNFAVIANRVGKYQEAYDTTMKCLETHLNMSNQVRRELEFNLIESIEKIKDKTLQYNSKMVDHLRISMNKKRAKKVITLTITTCKRFDLFSKTINSIMNCFMDIDKIDEWICVDDNSSEKDREEMVKLYPFFRYINKTPAEKGHAQSMNIIQKIVNTPYILHLEDDWHFFRHMEYIKPAIAILQSDLTYGQVLFNRNYAETTNDLKIPGGFPKTLDIIKKVSKQIPSHILAPASKPVKEIHKLRYILHEHYPPDSSVYLQKVSEYARFHYGTNMYWSHYSLRPSLIRTEIFKKIGKYDSTSWHFEMDYAHRYLSKGYVSAFFDCITCLHIGKLTTEKNKENAYSLNDVPQFEVTDIKKMDLIDLSEMFLFFPQLDSMYNDIKYVGGKSVTELMEICLQTPKCVCFNTLGFMKHKVEDQLVTSKHFRDVDGLYIRKGYEKHHQINDTSISQFHTIK